MILLSCQNYNRFPRPGKNILILKKTSLTPIIKDDARAEQKQNQHRPQGLPRGCARAEQDPGKINAAEKGLRMRQPYL